MPFIDCPNCGHKITDVGHYKPCNSIVIDEDNNRYHCGCTWRHGEPVAKDKLVPAPAYSNPNILAKPEGPIPPPIMKSVEEELRDLITQLRNENQAIRLEVTSLQAKVKDAQPSKAIHEAIEIALGPLRDAIRGIEKTMKALPNFSPYRNWTPKDLIDWGTWLSEDEDLLTEEYAKNHAYPIRRIVGPDPVEEVDPEEEEDEQD